uniref:Calcineurin-like phosphoesterase domain-containing protein n=1 Tax=Heterosigma akashiwo TaxID=2829 RepID=A0A7S3Y8T0_HETAK|mmetsp:Transcript_25297/g.42245  ORF Transcript_25297/g.42245 Transcript_25297/m.42245 type:complete len:406 (+) Transcript_25297:3-1220(+)
MVGHDSPYLLSQSFKGAASENPDLHFDIGDFNMNDMFSNKDASFEERVLIELNKRELYAPYLASIPIFMARGNHEGEFGFNMYNQSQSLYQTGDDMPTTSARARKAVFNNPEPDHFYTGNEEEYPFVGKLQNYFAFEWGDALFVTLDPYWPTKECEWPNGETTDEKNDDGKHEDGSIPLKKLICSPAGWQWTLGQAQYDWLTETLEDSDANHKFVFIHNFFKPRGGASDIPFYEWGGYGTSKPDDGTPGEWEFDTMRPGWAKPVHQLLVDNNVDVVMHGHDHVWAFEPQEEEGIIYQAIPKPNQLNWNQTIDNCDDGEYVNCKPSSGYTRVAVTEGSFRVEYVREALDPATNLRKAKSGDVMCGYTVTERGANETHSIQADANCLTSQWSSWQDDNGGEAQLLTQ